MVYSVHVRNVREEDEEAIRDTFGHFGRVLFFHRPTGSRNVFIRYGSKEEADLAVRKLQGLYEVSHAHDKPRSAKFNSDEQHGDGNSAQSATWNEIQRGGLSRDDFVKRESNKVENKQEDISDRNKYQAAQYSSEKRSGYKVLPQEGRYMTTSEDDLEMSSFMKRLELNRSSQCNSNSQAKENDSEFEDGPPPLVSCFLRENENSCLEECAENLLKDDDHITSSIDDDSEDDSELREFVEKLNAGKAIVESDGSGLKIRSVENKFDRPPLLLRTVPNFKRQVGISGVERLDNLPKDDDHITSSNDDDSEDDSELREFVEKLNAGKAIVESDGSGLKIRSIENKFNDGPPPLVPAISIEQEVEFLDVEECLLHLPSVTINKNDGDQMPKYADCLFVGNVNPATTSEDIFILFQRLEPVVITDLKYTPDHNPFRLIRFSTVKAVTFALMYYTGICLHGNNLSLKRLSSIVELIQECELPVMFLQ